MGITRNQLGAGVILTRDSDRLVATDPAAGRKLWTRKTDVESSDIWVDRGVVIRERSHLPNPVARPRFRIDRHGRPPIDYTDRSARMTLLDPWTGKEMASIVDRNARLVPPCQHHRD